jgi:N-acetylglucosamine malate deacetylase 1
MRSADSAVEVLAIGAHPDDLELGCGGTVALLASAGRRVGLLHLTRGERGTRGTVAARLAEAEAAARALGAEAVEFLDCGDGGLRTGELEEDALIAVLRRLRPELVLAPAPVDRHPDHGRANRLVHDACYYAGLARRGSGKPHRPAAVWCYMQHDIFAADLVVDVTAHWPAKLAALACYPTQLHSAALAAGSSTPPADSGDSLPSAAEPPTKVSSPEFAAAVEGRARHFGQAIGVALGEPFSCRGPLPVTDPFALLPRGLR